LGQPQFRGVLANPALEQLRQRIIASYHLGPMTEPETQAYILHRLKTVGWKDDPILSESFFAAVYSQTAGVPRRINTLCSRVLLFGYLEQRHAIGHEIVDQVAEELKDELGRVVDQSGTPLPVADIGSLAEVCTRIVALERSVSRHDRAIRRAIEIVAGLAPGKP
jgi:general secretion pathway protein A